MTEMSRRIIQRIEINRHFSKKNIIGHNRLIAKRVIVNKVSFTKIFFFSFVEIVRDS